jgi:hypothetical protein
MRTVVPVLVVFIAMLTAPALAQMEPVEDPSAGPDRSGFTILLTLGLGLQSGEYVVEGYEYSFVPEYSSGSEIGLGGLNLGIGGFVSPDLAVMFRISGTNVQYESASDNRWDTGVVSGVGGVSVQYWINDAINLEGGFGYGIASVEPPGTEKRTDKTGYGFIVGAGFSFFHRGKTSLQAGVEYAPVILDGGKFVHNLCIAFGYQRL